MLSTKEIRKGLYLALNVPAVTGPLAAGSASLYHARIPRDGAYPLVVYFKATGTPRHAFGGTVELTSQLWVVKAVVKGSTVSASPAEDVAAAVIDALDQQTLTIEGGTNLYSAWVNDVSYAEEDGDTLYRHEGAQFRIVAR